MVRTLGPTQRYCPARIITLSYFLLEHPHNSILFSTPALHYVHAVSFGTQYLRASKIFSDFDLCTRRPLCPSNHRIVHAVRNFFCLSKSPTIQRISKNESWSSGCSLVGWDKIHTEGTARIWRTPRSAPFYMFCTHSATCDKIQLRLSSEATSTDSTSAPERLRSVCRRIVMLLAILPHSSSPTMQLAKLFSSENPLAWPAASLQVIRVASLLRMTLAALNNTQIAWHQRKISWLYGSHRQVHSYASPRPAGSILSSFQKPTVLTQIPVRTSQWQRCEVVIVRPEDTPRRGAERTEAFRVREDV